MADGESTIDLSRYSSLGDFRLDVEAEKEEEHERDEGEEGEDGSLLFCFWVFLLKSATFPCTIFRQVNSDVKDGFPILVLNGDKRLTLLPPLPPQKESPDSEVSPFSSEKSYASSDSEFPFGKWVHVGCQVSSELLRLHIDGEVVDEKTLSASKDGESNRLRKISLVSTSRTDDGIEGYLYSPKVLHPSSSIEDHYKDSPVHLAIDKSSASDIEEGSDGIWSIVGGKASCRRNFALDVVLLDAFGQIVDKEMEVVASLLYANSGSLVEKTSDDEAPLLTSYDGIEFDSYEKPSKLLHGRASFKLKISQLSSKCDNRLFHMRFNIPRAGNYPFLEAFSNPIRCVSRNRNARTSLIIWKRPASGILPAKDSFGTHPDVILKNFETAEKLFSDSECTKMRNSNSKSMPSVGKAVPDSFTFSYCLAGPHERALLLKKFAASASDEEVLELANQVSLYTGCSHHWNQIAVAKKLIEEGTKLWSLLSQNNNHVPWESAIYEIEEYFMKIASCNTRTLSQQDFELLRRISGCQDYLMQENFERIWCWLYPVVLSLLRDSVRALWTSVSPRWIEGFITKEEAETSLRSPNGHQEPGTFVLRFPTSRSWPHPDAGCLVVTYMGDDYNPHHKLLSLDYICRSSRPLGELLLMEPGLSRLGRAFRSPLSS
ncbi:SH2 domain-containing protein A isoform X3 [Eucalyptus grandis]|uniref:SH2 domain-containing protein A isoform X3 n=1 Tax=Eucalyptus grandis TaxID=71139 RepID=UPI00192F105D|nr:SH2 domain-containing protein A isoform X3 [Eucalyptus grandis]